MLDINSIKFFVFVAIPYELRYFVLAVDVFLLILLIWWGLMIKKGMPLFLRIMSIFLPVGFFVGYGLFMAIIPYNFIAGLVESIFLGIFIYVIFSSKN